MSNGSAGRVDLHRRLPPGRAPWNLQSRLASPQPLCWLLEYRSGPCDDRLWRSRTVGISPAFAAKVWRRDLRRVIFTTRYPSKLQVRRCTSRPTFYPRGGTAEPRAHPHVCRGQPKHSCIITSTHSAHPGPLPVPSTRARMCPARALTGGCVRVPGPGWRLLGFKETVFGATSTCLVSSSRCRFVRVLCCFWA